MTATAPSLVPAAMAVTKAALAKAMAAAVKAMAAAARARAVATVVAAEPAVHPQACEAGHWAAAGSEVEAATRAVLARKFHGVLSFGACFRADILPLEG